tara:strand:+ start:556 stop:750 length:195 start_codon:yes stop_codon:yes gene_type:complete
MMIDIQHSNVPLADVIRLITAHNRHVRHWDGDDSEAVLLFDDFFEQYGYDPEYDGDDVICFMGY